MAARSLTNSISYAGTFASVDLLPNAPGAASNSALQVGDTAFVDTTSTMYYCTDATPGAAVWTPVPSGSVAPQIATWGGVADGLLAPTVTGSGGTYPTGFVGGEILPITLDGVHYDIAFTVNDQTLAQVISRINTVTGKTYASQSGAELRIASTVMASVINIQYGTALAALGLIISSAYGAVNPNATDNWAAFQTAIYANAGGTLAIPAGAYRIAVPPGADCALYISQTLRILGTGNVINGVAQLLFDNPTHSADFIVIEGSGARGTMLESLTIRDYHNTGDGRYGIVVHAPLVTLERIAFNGFGNANSYAIIQESGDVGAGIIAATRLPTGYYIGSNFLSVYQADIEYVGDVATGTGGGFFTHGSDSKAVLYNYYSLACGKGLDDSSLIGCGLYEYHDEVNYQAIYSDAASGTRLFNCFTEAFNPSSWITPVSTSFAGSLQASTYHFGVLSKLIRSLRSDSGISYEAEMSVPGYDMVLAWWRNGETYGSGIGRVLDSQGGDVFAMKTQPTAPVAQRGWAVGMTDPANTRGAGLAVVGHAFLNNTTFWKLRQTSITLAPGLNVIQMFANYAAASTLAQGDQYIPGVDTHCWVTVELHESAPDVTQPFVGGGAAADAQAATRLAALTAAPMRVGGAVCLWQDSVKGNWAVQLTNETAGSVDVDVIWSFSQWQTSGAASGP